MKVSCWFALLLLPIAMGAAAQQRSAIVDGGVHLLETQDFRLLVAPTAPMAGPLLRVTAGAALDVRPPRGAVVLITDESPDHTGTELARRMIRLGAQAVLFPANAESMKRYALMSEGLAPGKHHHHHPHMQPLPPGTWVAAMRPEAIASLATEPDGSTVTLEQDAAIPPNP